MKIVLAILLTVSIGINAVFFFSKKPAAVTGADPRHHTFTEQFPYLSAHSHDLDRKDLIINFVPLRSKLETFAAGLKFNYGIYFEYLPSGVPIDVKANEPLYSASLMKVPLVMEVYNRIEKGEVKKTDTLTLRSEHLDELYGKLWEKGEGHELTVEEAVRLTLIESDNTAARVLFDIIPDGNINEVFDALDIPITGINNQAVVSAFEYSSVLRSLYLSSYLTPRSSNEILKLLTITNQDNKLAAGVPSRIKVAHKMGVYNPDDPETSVYSDCGIVYIPNRPYILCAFARTDEATAHGFMETVSRMTYEYVANSNKK